MNEVWNWVVAHQLVLYIGFAILVEPMPAPDANSSKFYVYLYGVIQLAAAKWQSTVQALKPTLPTPPAVPPVTPPAVPDATKKTN